MRRSSLPFFQDPAPYTFDAISKLGGDAI